MKFNTALSVAGIILLYIAGSLCQLDVCGRAPLNNRVAGGENATAGAWPWQVSIHNLALRHICGGTLITKDWVLSAARCFLRLNESQIVMHFGLLSQFGSNPYETNRTASRIIRHPNYDFSIVDSNIALVQLSSSVTFSDYIKPVCLPAAGSVFSTGTESWGTGWGTGGQFFDILQEEMISIVNDSDCYNIYGPIITSNTICAGLVNQGAKRICSTDSGGPMVSRKGSLWIEFGIVSQSRGCDPKYPGIYIRVSQYQDWIKSYMGSNPPGFVEFNVEKLTSNSNFGSVLNLLLFSLSLTFSIIPFTFSIYLAS
ncbi:hypothetical protein PO909_000359 [Leuciscus waleckii]